MDWNSVTLEGLVQAPPVLSHKAGAVLFYRFYLRIYRLSGNVDVLPILIPENLIQDVVVGEPLKVFGSLRSYNNEKGTWPRVVLNVLAEKVFPAIGTPQNQIILSGVLCKTPTFRKTPLGKRITELCLKVKRTFGTTYVPIIAWDKNALRCSEMLKGQPLSLEGRVQSRDYLKQVENGTLTRTVYEVSLQSLFESVEIA